MPESLRSASSAELARAAHAAALMQATPDAVVAIDTQGRVTDWNPAAERMLGWRVDEVMGRMLGDLIVPREHREGHRLGMERYLRTREAHILNRTIEVPCLHRDGHRLPVELSVFPVGPDGSLGFGAFMRDITERQGQADALRQSEARNRAIVENLGEGMIVIQDRKVVFANPQAERALKRPMAQMIGATVAEWVHPDDHAMIEERRRRRDAGEAVAAHYEFRALMPDGEVRWLETHASALQWAGAPATMSFFSDVTERRQAIEQLQASEVRYRNVIDNLGEGMAVLQDGYAAFINPRGLELMRVTREQAMARPFFEWLHPDDRKVAAERQLRRQVGEVVPNHYELRVVDADGGIRWMNVHATAVPWEGRMATLSFFSDVTERKLTDVRLLRSEQRYRTVVEHVGEGMVVVQDGRFAFVNARACELVGLSQEAMMARGFLDSIHPDDKPLVAERHRKRLAGEAVPPRYEIRLCRPDGSVIWIDLGVTVVPWDTGEATLTFFTDVTERKELERTLTETLTERETILDNAIVGIAFLTPQGRFKWANTAMSEVFGVPVAEPLQSLEAHYLSRADYLRVGGEVARAIARGASYEAELQMRKGDGTVFWVHLSGKAVNPRDLSQGTVWAVLDIDQRMRLQEKLARTSSEREAILNSALVGISFNINRRLQWVNDKYLELTGYARDELLGQSSRLFYESDEAFEQHGEATRAALMAHGEYVDERALRRRDGHTLWVQLAGRCVVGRDPDQGVIWTLLDITERKRAEEDIRAALEQQRELNDLRSRFVAMTSHEFRTPLATILSSAELMRHYGDRLPAEEKDEVLASIESAVQRMTTMLERVLLIGKSDAQLLQCKPAPVDMKALCESVAQHVRTTSAHAKADLQVNCEALARPCLLDEKLVRHILENLVGNGIKYSPEGGTVRLEVRSGDGLWHIEVSDQGIGIPAAELPHLFESFHRASNVGNIQGTGLGLSIVKKAVDAHGGQISARSEAGQGTIFTVTLPLVLAS